MQGTRDERPAYLDRRGRSASVGNSSCASRNLRRRLPATICHAPFEAWIASKIDAPLRLASSPSGPFAPSDLNSRLLDEECDLLSRLSRTGEPRSLAAGSSTMKVPEVHQRKCQPRCGGVRSDRASSIRTAKES